MKPFPIKSLAVVLAATAFVFLPSLSELLQYDRTAILAGQWWRLVTGGLVHYDFTHYLANAVVIASVGSVAEHHFNRGYLSALALGLAGTGAYVHFFYQNFEIYRGLSGISVSVCSYLAIAGATDSKTHKPWFWALFLLICAKIAAEFYVGASLTNPNGQHYKTLPGVHLAGLCAGILAAAFRKINLCHKIEAARKRY